MPVRGATQCRSKYLIRQFDKAARFESEKKDAFDFCVLFLVKRMSARFNYKRMVDDYLVGLTDEMSVESVYSIERIGMGSLWN